MSLASCRCRAPRAPTAGALLVVCWAVALGLAGLGWPGAARAQVPDTIPQADTLQLADSLLALPDTFGLEVVGDSLQQVFDSLTVLSDSLSGLVDTFPEFSAAVAPSWDVGVWRWDRSGLESNRALTLAELVSQVPGVLPLRGGDYGTPLAAIAFGAAAGRVRVFLDGFEWVPLDGGVADLSRIGLGGLEEVRVERHPGELRIDLRARAPTDVEPQTLVEVGTGDLATNILRGILVHPSTLGGGLTFTLDRLETRGPALEAAGSLSGLGLRYAIARSNRGGFSAEWRRFAVKTDVEAFPGAVSRSDWNLRGRWRFNDALTGEAYWGASSLRGGADDPLYGDVDTRRSQLGIRARWQRGGVWARSSSRFLRGGGLPSATHEVAAGISHPRVGSLDGSLRLERWSGESASSRRVRAVTGRVVGLSLFASYEQGRSGVPFVPEFDRYLRSLEPPADTLAPDEAETKPPSDTVSLVEPLARFTERRGTRAGATFHWRSLSLSGARLVMEADSLRPLGVLLDRDTLVLAGGKRMGYEVAASLPLLIPGFRVEAAFQSWDEDEPYLPKRTWNGAFTYHRVFKESRNLEVWGALGVTGRDRMLLRVLDPDPLPDDPIEQPGGAADQDPGPGDLPLIASPFYQEWFTHIQVRVVNVHIFVRWENITGKEDNFDFPDREQPRFRTIYGVRWTMNN